MTTVTLGLDVLAAQDEFGVAVVVEGRNAPIFFGVAVFALRAEPPLVALAVIVGLVARDAESFQLFLE